MEKSVKFGFNLPSRDGDDIADINQISENFRIIEEKIYNKDEVYSIESGIGDNKYIKKENIQYENTGRC